ncbi:tyrosine-type recombinase/integrase [Paenibacillus sp. NPDC058071]|uniref:tyrosine-type recombinase/integrase n=1 Tax=Paenibacillus sp. NPDC058071 TaxID=3346326 RepID=UPI0036DC8559
MISSKNDTKLFIDIGHPHAYSTHCFRHTFAVNCLKAGMKIEFIAGLLGHKHIETTMIYTKMLKEDLLIEVQKYPIPLKKVLFKLFGMDET